MRQRSSAIRRRRFYIALIENPAAPPEVLADMLPVIVRTFPCESMRWGERSRDRAR